MKSKTLWRIVLLGAIVASLAALFRGVDFRASARCVLQLRGAAPLILLPYLLEVALDAYSWRFTFERGARVTWRGLLEIRIATEAPANSLPAGVAVAETLRALLLRERCGLPLTKAAANLVIAKLTTALGQGMFVVLGVALATSALRDNSQRLIGRGGLHHLSLAVAITFLTAMGFVLVVLGKGRLLGDALAGLQRLSGQRVGVWLSKLEQPFRDIDHGLAAADRVGRAQLALSVAISLCAWTCLALENWTIMHLLSPGVSFAEALSIEAILSVVRVMFFFLPAGLGAQEASYFALIGMYGVPHAEVVALAFIIAKRTKDLVWIGIGYLVLWRISARGANLKQATTLVASDAL